MQYSLLFLDNYSLQIKKKKTCYDSFNPISLKVSEEKQIVPFAVILAFTEKVHSINLVILRYYYQLLLSA